MQEILTTHLALAVFFIYSSEFCLKFQKNFTKGSSFRSFMPERNGRRLHETKPFSYPLNVFSFVFSFLMCRAVFAKRFSAATKNSSVNTATLKETYQCFFGVLSKAVTDILNGLTLVVRFGFCSASSLMRLRTRFAGLNLNNQSGKQNYYFLDTSNLQRNFQILLVANPGVTWVNVCLVCAAGLSEPPPHYSLFCGQIQTPSQSLWEKYNFRDPNIVTFFLCIYFIKPLNQVTLK